MGHSKTRACPQPDLPCATEQGCSRVSQGAEALLHTPRLMHSQCPTDTSLRIFLTCQGVIQVLAWEAWVNGSPINIELDHLLVKSHNVIHLALRSKEKLLQHRKCELHQLRWIIALPFIQLAVTYLSKNAGIQFCRKETHIRLSAAGEVVRQEEFPQSDSSKTQGDQQVFLICPLQDSQIGSDHDKLML